MGEQTKPHLEWLAEEYGKDVAELMASKKLELFTMGHAKVSRTRFKPSIFIMSHCHNIISSCQMSYQCVCGTSHLCGVKKYFCKLLDIVMSVHLPYR